MRHETRDMTETIKPVIPPELDSDAVSTMTAFIIPKSRSARCAELESRGTGPILLLVRAIHGVGIIQLCGDPSCGANFKL